MLCHCCHALQNYYIFKSHHACSKSALGLFIPSLLSAHKSVCCSQLLVPPGDMLYAAAAAYCQCCHSSQVTALMLQGEVMNVEAAPAAVGAVAPMVVPSEPVSIVVDEKLMVVLNKDGGVESMEVNGGMALQVTQLLSLQRHFCYTASCQ